MMDLTDVAHFWTLFMTLAALPDGETEQFEIEIEIEIEIPTV